MHYSHIIEIRAPFGKPQGCGPDCVEGKFRLHPTPTAINIALCDCMALRMVEARVSDSMYEAAIEDLRGWFYWRSALLRRKFIPATKSVKRAEGDENVEAMS